MNAAKDSPMSKHVNMTGHYKIAGRERQGEGILQASQKGAFAQQRQQARRDAIESQAGPPAWETTPPNLEIADTSKANARKTRKTKKANKANAPRGRKSSSKGMAKRARKPTPARKAARATSRPARRQSKSA